MNRWRKQTRVNGEIVETLRLRSLTTTGEVRGVILSLEIIHNKKNRTLTIEIDGESPLTEAGELAALKEAERLLQDAIALVQPLPAPPVPTPPSLKNSGNHPC
jgi:hypothetical protein